MRISLLALFAATSLVLVANAEASGTGGGAIPAGRYACDGGSYVDIRGNGYRGPSFEPSGQFMPYVVGAGNNITWTAGFGEFSVVSTKYMGVSQDSTAQPWFAITYNRTHGGGVEQVDCEHEGA
jgi:hypothetical protein